MRHFAAFLLLIGDVEESWRHSEFFGVADFARRDGHGVVVLHDGADESASGEIGAGARGGLGGDGAVVVGVFGGCEDIGVSGGMSL